MLFFQNFSNNEISCCSGEMESDQDDRKSPSKSVTSEKQDGKDLNISHEDLSDVSDLDSVGPDDTEKESKVCENKWIAVVLLPWVLSN